MLKRKLFICILLLEMISFSACTPSNSSEILSTQPVEPHSEMCNSDIDNGEVIIIEEEEFYKIIFSDNKYYYWIYDENHNIVKSGEPLNKKPHISMVNEHLLRFILQSGTGIGTQWGYYYNTEKDVLSRIFISILNQSDDKVIYCEAGKIVIRDIFDKTKYYQEISDFKEEFSEVAVPFITTKFVNGEKSIEVTYLSGLDFEEVTEIIKLP